MTELVCLECKQDMGEEHPWPGYCMDCFMEKQKEMRTWITENLSINRDAAGIVVATAGKTAAIVDTDFNQFNLLVYLRWFLENYRVIWEKNQVKINYKGEEMDWDEITVGQELKEAEKEEEEDYRGRMFG